MGGSILSSLHTHAPCATLIFSLKQLPWPSHCSSCHSPPKPLFTLFSVTVQKPLRDPQHSWRKNLTPYVRVYKFLMILVQLIFEVQSLAFPSIILWSQRLTLWHVLSFKYWLTLSFIQQHKGVLALVEGVKSSPVMCPLSILNLKGKIMTNDLPQD